MKTELILFSCCCCEDLENEAPRSSLFGWEIILNRHRRPPPQGSHAFSFHFHFLVMSYLSYFFLIFGNPALRSIGAFFAIVAYFVSSFYRLSLAAFLYFCLYVSFSQKIVPDRMRESEATTTITASAGVDTTTGRHSSSSSSREDTRQMGQTSRHPGEFKKK